MIESRCGILCNECTYKEQVNCAGCTKIHKPFWGDSCPVKDCCEGRGHEHCGQCTNFPCELLNEFAYNVEQGDDGKRIETCRLWHMKEKVKAEAFDVDKFAQSVVTQNVEVLKDFFTPDAVICWHDSNEQFNVDEYIRANCEYPGKWSGEVQRVEKSGDTIIMVTKICSDESSHLITAFAKLTNGKISRLDEYYSDINEVPDWRVKMDIGRPIN